MGLAGRGLLRTPTRGCHGRDTGCNITRRQSGQTSARSFMARKVCQSLCAGKQITDIDSEAEADPSVTGAPARRNGTRSNRLVPDRRSNRMRDDSRCVSPRHRERPTGQAASLAPSPDSLPQRQDARRAASYGKSRQKNAGAARQRPGLPQHPDGGAAVVTASPLSPDATFARPHPQEERQEASAWDSDGRCILQSLPPPWQRQKGRARCTP